MTKGYLVPDWLAEELLRNARESVDGLVAWAIANSPPRPPLTRRQRIVGAIRRRWWDAKWGLHDRMFGKHGEDYW